MCRVGEFNLSHASLTSAATLATLRLLPKTNPKLYEEISADTTHFHPGEEPAFFTPDNDLDDGCDIPIDVIRSTVMAGGSVVDEGFAIDDEGVVVRTGVAEELEAIEVDNNVPVELGRGRRVKIGSKKYGGEWEGH
jgi:hypothetical protein